MGSRCQLIPPFLSYPNLLVPALKSEKTAGRSLVSAVERSLTAFIVRQQIKRPEKAPDLDTRDP